MANQLIAHSGSSRWADIEELRANNRFFGTKTRAFLDYHADQSRRWVRKRRDRVLGGRSRKGRIRNSRGRRCVFR